MDVFGRHILAELWDCDRDKLNNISYVERTLVDAALIAGAEIREVVFHKFAPHGVSGVVIISESHLTIHSFPEHGYASIDVYTCGEHLAPETAVDAIARGLKAETTEKIVLSRGVRSKTSSP